MRTSGFTLVELLVAIFVMTMVASFIVPTYQLILAQAQLGEATTQITDFLRLTEQKTVTEQQIYGVTLTANATTIPQYVYNPLTSAKTVQTTFALPTNVKVYAVNFSGNADVRFTTAGGPNVSGNVVIMDTIRTKKRQIDIRPSGTILANSSEF